MKRQPACITPGRPKKHAPEQSTKHAPEQSKNPPLEQSTLAQACTAPPATAECSQCYTAVLLYNPAVRDYPPCPLCTTLSCSCKLHRGLAPVFSPELFCRASQQFLCSMDACPCDPPCPELPFHASHEAEDSSDDEDDRPGEATRTDSLLRLLGAARECCRLAPKYECVHCAYIDHPCRAGRPAPSRETFCEACFRIVHPRRRDHLVVAVV
jgi:hypothetical protein